MIVNEVFCLSILTRVTGYLKGVASHSINPYVGCGFGKSACGVGCYVRHNQLLLKGREWGGFVDVKINSPEVYLKTWRGEKNRIIKEGVKFSLFCSSSTDPWQPIERKYRVTRRLLEVMNEAPPDELILQTHSNIILDDLDLIAKLSRNCELRLHISIEGDLDRLPGLPSPPCSVESRFRLVEKFFKAGINVVVCLSPIYPVIDPSGFFQRLRSAGTSAVVIDHFIDGDGSKNGLRTKKTNLPEAMAEICPESVKLSYRDEIVDIAREYLPVGISRDGFAGRYLPIRE